MTRATSTRSRSALALAEGRAMTRDELAALERALREAEPPDAGPARERARRPCSPRRRRGARVGAAAARLGRAGRGARRARRHPARQRARAGGRAARARHRRRAEADADAASATSRCPRPGGCSSAASDGLFVVDARRATRPRSARWDDATWSPAGLFVARDRGPHARRARPGRRHRALAPAARRARSASRAGRPDGTAHRLPRRRRRCGSSTATATHDVARGPRHGGGRARLAPERRRTPSPGPRSDGTVTVEDADTAKVLRTYRGGAVRQLAWSGDGRRLLIAGRRARHDPRLRHRPAHPARARRAARAARRGLRTERQPPRARRPHATPEPRSASAARVLLSAGRPPRRPRLVPRRPLAARGRPGDRSVARSPTQPAAPTSAAITRRRPLRLRRPHPRLVLLIATPRSSAQHAEQPQLAERPALVELDPGAGDEVLHGRGGEDLAGLRRRAATSAAIASAGPLELPSRSSHSPVWMPARSAGTCRPARSRSGPRGRGRRSSRACVPGGASSALAAEAREHRVAAAACSDSGRSASRTVVSIRLGLGGASRRPPRKCSICVEHRLLVALPRQVVGARHLDDLRARQPLAHVAARLAQVLAARGRATSVGTRTVGSTWPDVDLLVHVGDRRHRRRARAAHEVGRVPVDRLLVVGDRRRPLGQEPPRGVARPTARRSAAASRPARGGARSGSPAPSCGARRSPSSPARACGPGAWPRTARTSARPRRRRAPPRARRRRRPSPRARRPSAPPATRSRAPGPTARSRACRTGSAAPSRQPPVERRQRRPLPAGLERAHPPVHEDDVQRPVAHHLVGDRVAADAVHVPDRLHPANIKGPGPFSRRLRQRDSPFMYG